MIKNRIERSKTRTDPLFVPDSSVAINLMRTLPPASSAGVIYSAQSFCHVERSRDISSFHCLK